MAEWRPTPATEWLESGIFYQRPRREGDILTWSAWPAATDPEQRHHVGVHAQRIIALKPDGGGPVAVTVASDLVAGTGFEPASPGL